MLIVEFLGTWHAANLLLDIVDAVTLSWMVHFGNRGKVLVFLVFAHC